MKGLLAFALGVVVLAPASAQETTTPRRGIDLEFLELEQDVDRTILREALMLRGRKSMNAAIDPNPVPHRRINEEAALSAFIDGRKEAIRTRSAELAKQARLASGRATPEVATAPDDPPSKVDRQALIERIENAGIEVQLLQAQLDLLQGPLKKAVHEFAVAELAASHDHAQGPEADKSRKEYETVKARYVEHRKRLLMEQERLNSMQLMGGMGGGMR